MRNLAEWVLMRHTCVGVRGTRKRRKTQWYCLASNVIWDSHRKNCRRWIENSISVLFEWTFACVGRIRWFFGGSIFDERLRTFGSDLLELSCQALARKFMAVVRPKIAPHKMWFPAAIRFCGISYAFNTFQGTWMSGESEVLNIRVITLFKKVETRPLIIRHEFKRFVQRFTLFKVWEISFPAAFMTRVHLE